MFDISYRSGIARAKKILIAAGFPWSVTSGRYSPFAQTQTTTRGVRVTRVGRSGTISVHVYREENRDTWRWMNALAVATLQDAGMPFDERGWLTCRNDF